MKTAIYIEDGLTQLVLTPDTEWEKSALLAIDREGGSITIFRGSFYDSQGGWVSQAKTDESLIIRLNSATKQPNTPTLCGDSV